MFVGHLYPFEGEVRDRGTIQKVKSTKLNRIFLRVQKTPPGKN
jgi:hypothetical protein